MTLLDPRASMDAMVKRKNPFTAPVGNRTPVIQPVAPVTDNNIIQSCHEPPDLDQKI